MDAGLLSLLSVLLLEAQESPARVCVALRGL